jgi:transcriptional regulator with XRE-family HTH domain
MALPPQAAAQSAAKERLQEADQLAAAEHLLSLREAMGWSQGRLASIVGGQAPNVHDWENGKKKPRPPTPAKIEAWSRLVVRELGLPESAVLLHTKWLTPEARAEIEAIESAIQPEAS